MPRPTRYREIEVTGSPRQMGQQIGEAARDEVRGFCEIALERTQKTVAVSRATALDVARRSGEMAEQYAPHMMEELRGTAESAGVTLDDLMLLQVRNQLQPEADAGCTSLAVTLPDPESSTAECVTAQNWDNDPELDAFTVVLTRRPDDQPAFMCCTQAGLIAYLGFNDAGIGACVNTLPAPSRSVGVPHYFTLRGVYECRSLQEAVEAIRRAHRAIPANLMLATPQGPADLEVTLDDVHVLRPEDAAAAIAHTNHCVHPELRAFNDQFPELIQSHARQRRIGSLLAARSDAFSIDAIRSLLTDHEDHPTSICRHANSEPNTGFWETVFSLIVEPSQRRMHVARGTPCDHPYETYYLK